MTEWAAGFVSFLKSIWPALMKGVGMLSRTFRLVGSEESWISRAVPLVHAQVDRNELRKDEPRLVFQFTGFNGSLSAIELLGSEGEIRFGDSELAGSVRAELVATSSNPIKRLEWFGFLLIQRISKDMAKKILDTPQPGSHHISFGFRKVRVQFVTQEEKNRPRRKPFEIRLPPFIQVDAESSRWVVTQQPSIFQNVQIDQSENRKSLA